jgi:hypothetical protein
MSSKLGFESRMTYHAIPRSNSDIIDENKNPASLVPYFFLYVNDNAKYADIRKGMLTVCKNSPIAKNLYIQSIIEGENCIVDSDTLKHYEV